MRDSYVSATMRTLQTLRGDVSTLPLAHAAAAQTMSRPSTSRTVSDDEIFSTRFNARCNVQRK